VTAAAATVARLTSDYHRSTALATSRCCCTLMPTETRSLLYDTLSFTNTFYAVVLKGRMTGLCPSVPPSVRHVRPRKRSHVKPKINVDVSQGMSNRCTNFELRRSKVMRTDTKHVGRSRYDITGKGIPRVHNPETQFADLQSLFGSFKL